MTIGYNHLQATVHASRIAANYRLLLRAGTPLMPVVKSDAYGHGLEPVVCALEKEGATFFAVGAVQEAVQLRESGFAGRILALLGAQDDEEAEACFVNNIIPLVYRMDQLDMLDSCRLPGSAPVSIALKFDTGMARLGFPADQAAAAAKRLQRSPRLRTALVCSHLAAADEPDKEDFTLEQGRRFDAVLQDLRAGGVDGFQASLANSAGLLAWSELRRDLARPGISLYGGNPFHHTAWARLAGGLVQAMDVTAPVLQIRDLTAGTPISYGCTYTAPRDMRAAIVAAGYADCYSRVLSSPQGNGAAMQLHGRRAAVLGRVCMQMTAVDVTHIPEAKPGDQAFLLGGDGENAIRAEELADWWGTNSYEVMCVLGQNPRRHVQKK